jgi:hypothetical protein
MRSTVRAATRRSLYPASQAVIRTVLRWTAAGTSMSAAAMAVTVFTSLCRTAAAVLPKAQWPAALAFGLTNFAASSTGGQVQLTIQTAQSSATASLRRVPGGVVLALLLSPLLGTRRLRRLGRTRLLMMVLLAGGMAGLTGCGAGNGLFAQPPQNYTVTVTVTSGSVQHTIDYTLNLQ